MDLPAAPAWTLKGKKCTIDKLNDGYEDCSPGPLYNTSQLGRKINNSSYTTGKSNRCQINHGVLNNPSPSDYNPNNPNLITHSVSFTKQMKYRDTNTEENPDPSAYKFNPNIIKQKAPLFSLGSRYPSIMDDTGNNPGPGFYNNPEVTLAATQSKNSRFGTQPRFSQPNAIRPGPGDYNLARGFYNDKGTLSKSQKFLSSDNKKPGPGQYNHSDQFVQNTKLNKGKSLGKLFSTAFDTASNTVQSFGNYFRDQKKDTGRSFSVGKQKRQVFMGNDNPGPTDYKPKNGVTNKNSPNAKFTKSKFVEINEVIFNPGPGQYQQKKYDSLRYTIPKSKSVDHFNSNPGVGRYKTITGMGDTNYKYKNQLIGNKIGKSLRTNFVSKNIAGVGDYTLLTYKTGGISIPKASRFPKPNNNPGPQHYQMHSTLSNFNMYRNKTASLRTTAKSTNS